MCRTDCDRYWSKCRALCYHSLLPVDSALLTILVAETCVKIYETMFLKEGLRCSVGLFHPFNLHPLFSHCIKQLVREGGVWVWGCFYERDLYTVSELWKLPKIMNNLLFLTDMRTTRLQPLHTRRSKGQVCSPEACLSLQCVCFLFVQPIWPLLLPFFSAFYDCFFVVLVFVVVVGDTATKMWIRES